METVCWFWHRTTNREALPGSFRTDSRQVYCITEYLRYAAEAIPHEYIYGGVFK